LIKYVFQAFVITENLELRVIQVMSPFLRANTTAANS